MTLTVQQVTPAQDYLSQFFKAHFRKYQRMMQDAGGAKYGVQGKQYERYNEIIGCIRDIVLAIDNERFVSLRIPQDFVSPDAFIQEVTALRDLAADHADRIEEINRLHESAWHQNVSHAHQIASEVRDATNHALNILNLEMETPVITRLIRLLERLPIVSRVLLDRYNDRSTIKVGDEYDVQDLMRAFLHLEFVDIRAEVWIPNYAGTNSRTDFVLQQEKILVEVKHATKKHGQKAIVDELAIDIMKYRNFPEVNHLVCAVWDTEHTLINPVALKTDVEAREQGFVTVVVMH